MNKKDSGDGSSGDVLSSHRPRRDFLRAGGLLLTYAVGGNLLSLAPSEARAQNVPFTTFSPEQAADVDALGEAMVPGAVAAGISHYLDHQISGPDTESLLMARYLGVAPPFLPFYSAALDGASAASKQRFNLPPAKLNANQLAQFVADMAQGTLEGWSGPPSAFFYFVLRADAADVTYGTQSGFERLGVPYLAHIEPETDW